MKKQKKQPLARRHDPRRAGAQRRKPRLFTVNEIADAVCNSEWRCPINEAGAECDCNGSKGVCPLVKALELFNDEKGMNK